MDASEKRSVTTLLGLARGGDRQAREELYEIMYPELKRLASSYMRRERKGHTLQTTALVSEFFLRLTKNEDVTPRDRNHFMQIAAGVIRRILVDHARRFKAKKRGSGDKVPLDDIDEPRTAPPDEDILALNEALDLLGAEWPEELRLVELRHFLGVTNVEAAEIMGIGERDAETLWSKARKRLHALLSTPPR